LAGTLPAVALEHLLDSEARTALTEQCRNGIDQSINLRQAGQVTGAETAERNARECMMLLMELETGDSH
jgi:hypothetical protein